eukprot:scaffold21675_cov42-Phaeocystis_antarctica.AAC.1
MPCAVSCISTCVNATAPGMIGDGGGDGDGGRGLGGGGVRGGGSKGGGSDGGDGGGDGSGGKGGGGDGGLISRSPQSAQSWPNWHPLPPELGPPSSQAPSSA